MPTTAITKNNAGIVEAIKRQSGSTKFYKPSFEGIIQAILDWKGGGGTEGGGGAVVLPEGGTPPSTGNTEGDMVVIPNSDGDYFIYVFADGAWERMNVTTEDVLPAGSAPLGITADDGTVLNNQSDINKYFDALIKELQELEGYDDGELRTLIEELQEAVDELPVTVADAPPDGEDGDLWFDSTADDLQLFVRYDGEWVVASPPVSTEDIENSILEIQEILAAADALSIQRGNQIAELQSKIYNVAAGVVAIEDSLGKVTLQEVLDNGAVANKGMILKSSNPEAEGSSEYDAIEIVPAAARLAISAEDGAGWKPTLELIELVPGNAGATRKAQLELDDNRLDINVESREDEIHFRFSDEDKLCLKAMGGPSELKGKLIVEPGSQGNEAATYGQLVTLEEEIEQLRPTFDHGQWEYSPESYAQDHKYVLIQEFLEEDAQEALCTQELLACTGGSSDPTVNAACNREFDACMDKIEGNKWVTTSDWSKVETIGFSSKSLDGTEHSFERVKVGMLVDIFNVNDDGYMVATINEITEGADGTGFKVTHEQSKGQANGPATVKFFNLPDGQEIELSNYLRRDGDKMEGYLTIDRPRSGSNQNSFIIRGRVNGVETSLLKDYQRKNTDSSMDDYIEYFGDSPNAKSIINVGWTDEHLVGREGTQKMGGELQIRNENGAACLFCHGKGTTTVFYVQGEENRTLFRVKGNGQVQAGTDENHALMARNGHDIVTKKYLDSRIPDYPAPGPFTWLWEPYNDKSAVSKNHFTWQSGKFLYLSRYTYNGATLANPSNLPSGANYFASYLQQVGTSNAKHLKMWMLNNDGSWELMAWAVPYKYRFNYGGWVQLEYKNREGSLPDVADSHWCITLPDLL